MPNPFNVIVVGARCAGAPSAMLLARKGYRVLMVDRATFPSDTISTLLIHPPGVAALNRWGLGSRLAASGCPPIHTYAFDMGPFVISGSPGTADTADVSYAPRRTVLDKLLVDAAVAAGVEVREGFVVDDVLMDRGRVTGIRGHGKNGTPVDEHADVVVGADGLNSVVAKAVSAEQYNDRGPVEAGYYSYWSGLPTDGKVDAYSRPGRAFAAWPTHDNLTLVVANWPMAEFDANKSDIEASFLKTIRLAPRLWERLRAAKREDRFLGMVVPGFFRKPFGPGWALVGDAGYNTDFITAQGISDAFRSAEWCTDAIDSSFSGRSGFDDAMARYQTDRDLQARPTYEFTYQFAALAPPPPQMQQLMAAMLGNQKAMNGFTQVFAGMLSPARFFSDENVGRIFAAAKAKATGMRVH